MTSVFSSSEQLAKLRLEGSRRPLVAMDRLINLGFGQGFGSWSITFTTLRASFFGTASSPPPTLQNTVAIWRGWVQGCYHPAGQPAGRKQRKTEAKVPPSIWVRWVCRALTSQSLWSVTISSRPPLYKSLAGQLDRPKSLGWEVD